MAGADEGVGCVCTGAQGEEAEIDNVIRECLKMKPFTDIELGYSDAINYKNNGKLDRFSIIIASFLPVKGLK